MYSQGLMLNFLEGAYVQKKNISRPFLTILYEDLFETKLQ